MMGSIILRRITQVMSTCWTGDQSHKIRGCMTYKARKIIPVSLTFLIPRRWDSTESATEKPEKNFKCTVCDKQFLGKLALEHHMSLRHGQGKVLSTRSTTGAPQSFQSLIDGYDARRIERIDRKKYSREPLIINGKPETEEERKARLKKVIEEREKLRHKSVSVTDIPVVLNLVEMWDNFSIKRQDECKSDLEEGEILPFSSPHVKYTPLTLEQIKEYIQNRKKELGYDEDAHSWMSDGIPLGVFKAANDKKREKQTEELQKVHFGSRQLNSMTEPNPYKSNVETEVSELPFKCSKCGKGYRSKMSMEFHFNTTCKGGGPGATNDSAAGPADKNANPITSKVEYVEGPLPSPRQPTSEEQSIVNDAQREYPPKNPFQGESEDTSDRSMISNDLPSKTTDRQNTEGSINIPPPSGTSMLGAKEISSNTYTTDEFSQPENTMEDTRIGRSVNPFKIKQEVAYKDNFTSIDEKASRFPMQGAVNPFKQAAFSEKKRHSDGVALTGLADDHAYTKIMDKIESDSKVEQGAKETADVVLQSTVGSQHRILKSFTSAKNTQQNPFRSYSPGAQPTPPTMPAAPQTKSKNPFASFSVSSVVSPQSDKQSSSSSRMSATTSTMNAPSYSVFAEGKSLQPPSTSAPKANPFLRGFPFGRVHQTPSTSKVGVDTYDATASKDAAQKSKLTCPQCGMAFRLQRALDAHISTSHTIASSLYTDPSFTESNDINPFQPTGVKPTIPADPFID